MALKLSKQNKLGYTMEYHKILSIGYKKSELLISIGTYKDKSAKDSGCSPADMKNYHMPKSGYDTTSPDRPQIYTYLKSLPEFSGAEDC